MEHTPLRQLGAGQRGVRIRCRVLQIWDSTNPSQQDQLMTVDLLLADENGDCIQASIRKEDASRLRGVFEEGKIYNIANFIMAPARRKYRLSQNESVIRIGTWTIVREHDDPHSQIPLHCFTFIDEEALESRLYNDVFLTVTVEDDMPEKELIHFITNAEILMNERDGLEKALNWKLQMTTQGREVYMNKPDQEQTTTEDQNTTNKIMRKIMLLHTAIIQNGEVENKKGVYIAELRELYIKTNHIYCRIIQQLKDEPGKAAKLQVRTLDWCRLQLQPLTLDALQLLKNSSTAQNNKNTTTTASSSTTTGTMESTNISTHKLQQQNLPFVCDIFAMKEELESLAEKVTNQMGE